jgi:hypothetical protein
MRSATGEALKEKGAALPSADGVHEASSSKTRTEEHRTGNGGGGAGSLMLLTHSLPSSSVKETNEKKSCWRPRAGDPAPAGTRDFVPLRQLGTLLHQYGDRYLCAAGLPFYSGRTVTWAPRMRGRKRERVGPAWPGQRACAGCYTGREWSCVGGVEAYTRGSADARSHS